MVPPPCAFILRTTARNSRAMAATFTWIISSSRASSVSRMLPQTPKPALLMKMSMCSSASTSHRRLHSSARERSAVSMRHSVPWAACSSLARACKRSARRAVRMSRQPIAAYRRANSRPMPELAPVIQMVFCMVVLLFSPPNGAFCTCCPYFSIVCPCFLCNFRKRCKREPETPQAFRVLS